MADEVEATVAEVNPSGPTVAELEQAASDFLGVPNESQQEPVAPTETPEAQAVPTDQTPKADTTVQALEKKEEASALLPEEKELLDQIRAMKEVTGTPFKGVPDVVKAWKEATAELTKQRQATKPYEQFLSRLQNDPQFRQQAEQFTQFYEHPELRQAYLNQLNPSARPDPRRYDFSDPAQVAEYDKGMEDFMARQVDSRIQQRLAPLEQDRVYEKQKWEFKQAYPDVDPETVASRFSEIQQQNPLVNLYKTLEYDNLKANQAKRESEIRAEVTKELTAKIQQAGKTTTPQASPSAPKPSIVDIINMVSRYGVAAATKKYGLEVVENAVAEQTNQAFA